MNYGKRNFRKRKFGNVKSGERMYVVRGNVIGDCWKFERVYAQISGEYIHKMFACGEGKVVRHLCMNNYCVNPLHLVKGTDIENARDEVVVRDFTLKLLEDMTEDYSLRDLNERNDVKFYVMVARATLKLRPMYGFKNIGETIKYARDRYRMYFVDSIKDKIDSEEMSERLIKANKLLQLVSERGIEIVEIMEGL